MCAHCLADSCFVCLRCLFVTTGTQVHLLCPWCTKSPSCAKILNGTLICGTLTQALLCQPTSLAWICLSSLSLKGLRHSCWSSKQLGLCVSYIAVMQFSSFSLSSLVLFPGPVPESLARFINLAHLVFKSNKETIFFRNGLVKRCFAFFFFSLWRTGDSNVTSVLFPVCMAPKCVARIHLKKITSLLGWQAASSRLLHWIVVFVCSLPCCYKCDLFRLYI